MMLRPAALLLVAALALSGCSFLRDVSENLQDTTRQIGEALGLCCDEEEKVEGPPVRAQWEGTFPVADLVRLPERGDQLGTGLIADPETWSLVWRVFRPDDEVPAIDFSKEFIAFARNLTAFGKISLVHVAIGGNSMDLRWRTPDDGPKITDKVRIAFVVLRRGEFGLVRSLGHSLVLGPPPDKTTDEKAAGDRKTSRTGQSRARASRARESRARGSRARGAAAPRRNVADNPNLETQQSQDHHTREAP